MGRKTMTVAAIVLVIVSLPCIFIGFMFVWSSFPDSNNPNYIPNPSNLPIGIVTALFALVLIAGAIVLFWLASRQKAKEMAQNVTIKVDLPGETKIEQMKCRSCGGSLTTDNIKLVNGAPVVTCPYCNTVYQLTEEPKW